MKNREQLDFPTPRPVCNVAHGLFGAFIYASVECGRFAAPLPKCMCLRVPT